MTKLSSAIRHHFFAVLALAWLSGLPIAHSANAPSQPDISAPELARLGAFKVGTSESVLRFAGRVRITPASMAGGSLPTQERKLNVRMWYPAQPLVEVSQPASYPHQHIRLGKPALQAVTQGIAIPNALPVANKRFPLVVVSHGYGGWDTSISNLTENLASKGYVVAAIDHADAPFTNLQEFQLSFGNVLLDRAQDQRQTIAALLRQAKTDSVGVGASIDPEQVALIGYSMGGFGALATSGASYDADSSTVRQLPGDAQTSLLKADLDVARQIKALVAVAPWGGQPTNRSWTPQALGQIKAPVLMIAGDGDDVVDFRHGVSWIFDSMTGTDRHMLVYQNARHNIVGDPAPPEIVASGDFKALEYFSDPVWRTERMNGINQHFITAFLDWRLKGVASSADYLNTPTVSADDGQWPAAFGEPSEGKTAGVDQPKYWRGFQRRWAMGLGMYRAQVGVRGTLESASR
nr:dienelactone hydrolase family protein [Rhodoferax sp.]